jgi:uncharacterized damage-inducible protein DinB
MMNGEQAKVFLSFFLGNIENEHPTTRKIIAAVPQEKSDYKPDPKSMSARELAFHIAGSDIFFLDAILKGQFDMSGEQPPVPAMLTDILAWYEENYNDRLAKLKALPADQLTKTVKFFGVMELPAVMYLQLMLMHMSHHRGQLSTYLRPMGSKVPAIYGGSADEPFQMPAHA